MELIAKNLCAEAPVDLFLNRRKLVTFMCTPENLNELALGYLYTRGLIASTREVLTLAACDDMRKVYVSTSTDPTEEQYGLAGVLTSGCGSDSLFSEGFLGHKPLRSDFLLPLLRLEDLVRQMFQNAELYKETGGVHCAAIANQSELVVLREDVGRHNAVDKVIGKGLFMELDFQQCAILTTGRISSDMVLKAVAGGFPIVASRSIPTTLALEIAERMGITLVGRVVHKEPIIYSHPARIIR